MSLRLHYELEAHKCECGGWLTPHMFDMTVGVDDPPRFVITYLCHADLRSGQIEMNDDK